MKTNHEILLRFPVKNLFFKEKTVDWYWLLGAVTLLSAFTIGFYGNYLFSGIIVLGGFLLGFVGSKDVPEHFCEISEGGISIENIFYSYEDISSFYIFTEGEQKRFKLLLQLKRTIHPFLSVSVASLKEEEIDILENFLKGKLPEKKRHPTLSDFVGEIIGF
jgi:hypothetical protein